MMELPGSTAKASARRVLKNALLPVIEEARANAPERTGGLKSSYTVGTRLTRAQRRANRKKSEVEMYGGPNDPAAIQTEFGNEHQIAQPHLRPAWDSGKAQVLGDIKDLLWIDIEKTVVRYRKRQAKLRSG